MSIGSNRQPQVVTTTQNKDPWSVAQPDMAGAIAGARALYQGDVGYKPWQGETVAPFSGDTQRGMQGVLNTAQGGVPNLGAANSAIGGLLNMDGQGADDPYLKAMLEASNANIGNTQASLASGAGRYGSGAHTQAATKAMADAANPILFQANQAARNRQIQAAGMLPTMNELQYDPANRMMQIGGMTDQRNQSVMNSALERYNANEARPWEALQRYAAIANGAGGLGGSQVGTQQIPQASQMQRMLGGGLLGGSMLGPMGALGGGLLGAFM